MNESPWFVVALGHLTTILGDILTFMTGNVYFAILLVIGLVRYASKVIKSFKKAAR